MYSVALAINDAGEVGGVSIDAAFTALRAFVVVNGRRPTSTLCDV